MGFFLPALTQENLDTQRDVVMNERRQRVENQPYGLAGERLHELLYPPDHPYHWPVIGYMEDIAAATLEDVREFFRTYYAPNNAVLTLAGDFDPDDALRADREPGSARSRAGPPVPPVPAPRCRRSAASAARCCPTTSGCRASISASAPRPTASAAGTPPTCSPACSPAASRARCYRDLVYERQIAQDVGAYVSPYEEVGDLHGGRHGPAGRGGRDPGGGASSSTSTACAAGAARRRTSSSGRATGCSPSSTAASRSWTTGPISSPSSRPISTIPAASSGEADRYREIDRADAAGLRRAHWLRVRSGWWSPSCRGERELMAADAGRDRSAAAGRRDPPVPLPAVPARGSCASGLDGARRPRCRACRWSAWSWSSRAGGQHDPRGPGGPRHAHRRR